MPETPAPHSHPAHTIDEMIAKKGFVVAHRGGSKSWPESSLKAFTNAAALGADALEFSTSPTKDGVWVGSHDSTLMRVDPSAPDIRIVDMTYAEVQKYRTHGEPIIRIEELVEAVGLSHVFVIDPKDGTARVTDLLKVIESIGLTRENTILKSEAKQLPMAHTVHEAGWKCWAFVYEKEIDELPQWADAWDFLGMQWDASPETWDRINAYGKPVWGHICENREQYDEAMRKGAAGCMTAGVADVLG